MVIRGRDLSSAAPGPQRNGQFGTASCIIAQAPGRTSVPQIDTAAGITGTICAAGGSDTKKEERFSATSRKPGSSTLDWYQESDPDRSPSETITTLAAVALLASTLTALRGATGGDTRTGVSAPTTLAVTVSGIVLVVIGSVSIAALTGSFTGQASRHPSIQPPHDGDSRGSGGDHELNRRYGRTADHGIRDPHQSTAPLVRGYVAAAVSGPRNSLILREPAFLPAGAPTWAARTWFAPASSLLTGTAIGDLLAERIAPSAIRVFVGTIAPAGAASVLCEGLFA